MHTILEFSHGKNTNCFFILNAFILKILNWSGGHGLASVNTITWNFHIIFVYSSRMFLIHTIFLFIHYDLPLQLNKTTSRFFTQGCFMSNLVESGHVVLEKIMKMWKFTTSCTDIGIFYIKKLTCSFGSGKRKSFNQAKSDYLRKGASKCMTIIRNSSFFLILINERMLCKLLQVVIRGSLGQCS